LSAGQHWQKYGSGIYDFTATEKFIIQAELKVVTFTYNPSIGGTGNWRAGYYLAAYDDATRWIAFDITSDGIRISRRPELEDSNSTPFISFDTTAAFNTYRAEIANGQMEIFINGLSKGTLTVGGPIGSLSDKNALVRRW